MKQLHLCLSEESQKNHQAKVKSSFKFQDLPKELCECVEKEFVELGSSILCFLVLQVAKKEILLQLSTYKEIITKNKKNGIPCALALDGKALEVSLSKDVRDHFFSNALNCDVVICCRVSPKQKALVGPDLSICICN